MQRIVAAKLGREETDEEGSEEGEGDGGFLDVHGDR